MGAGDLPGVLAIQAEAYAGAAFAPEQPAVYTDRMRVAPDLCIVALNPAGTLLGYLVSHPWHTGAPPSLDIRLPPLPPACGCWYLHDCAVARTAHGAGVAAALYDAGRTRALAQGLRTAALVAVGGAAGYWARRGYAVCHRPELADKLAGYGQGARYMARELT
ncbi:acetyltransferase [Pseudorhodoferax sp. Leaf267]|nr:acetyltransferase [Pseudorhodoferax sp. Leaf267]